ncbi:DNA damage-inducible transcript 4 protein [Varanus komodoensis]|nr:DNA damage-inducible transcript 4 protein [Varanus komodoensis]
MPVSWDSFSSTLPPIPEQRENPPAFAWEKSAYQEAASRTARLESSDCESLDSSLSSEGDAQEYLDEVSLPDFDLLNDPEDELLCANLMKLIQVSLNKAKINSHRSSKLFMPSQLVTQGTQGSLHSSPSLHFSSQQPCEVGETENAWLAQIHPSSSMA